MNESVDYTEIGRRIRKVRRDKDITQNQLAELVNLTPSYISNLENGNTKPSLSSLILMANTLDTSVDYLLGNNQTYIADRIDTEAKDLLSDCSEEEREFLLGLLVHAKADLRKRFHTR